LYALHDKFHEQAVLTNEVTHYVVAQRAKVTVDIPEKTLTFDQKWDFGTFAQEQFSSEIKMKKIVIRNDDSHRTISLSVEVKNVRVKR
jgi:hypothetical protein